MVQVFKNTGSDKRGVWSDSRIVLNIDKDARTIVVSTKHGRQATVAIEDVRPAFPEDTFANAVQTAIDTVDDTIEDLIELK